MAFYVYENWTAKNVKIHKGQCGFCNNGNGRRGYYGNKNGKWHGSIKTYLQAQHLAIQLANNLGTNYRNCKRCHPEINL